MTRFWMALLAFASAAAMAVEAPFASSPIGAAPYGVSMARVAGRSGRSLVVWSDQRGGIFTTFLREDGTPVGERSLLLTRLLGDTLEVAAGDNSYLVAYGYYSAPPESKARIGFIRVMQDGTFTTLPSSVAGRWIDSATWSGGYYVVAYHDPSGARALFAVLDPDGAVVVQDAPLFSAVGWVEPTVTLAAGPPGELLVAWAEPLDHRIHAARTTIGQLRSTTAFVSRTAGTKSYSSLNTPPSVAWNGTSYLVGWVESQMSPFPPFVFTDSVRVRLIDPRGAALGEPRTIIDRTSEKSVFATDIHVGSNGAEFVVAYKISGPEVGAIRLSASGAPLDAAPRRISSDYETLLAGTAETDGHHSVVFIDRTKASFLIQLVSAEESADPPITLRRSLPLQTMPVSAECNPGRVFAWVDRSHDDMVYVAEADASGRGPGVRRIAYTSAYVNSLSVACNAETLLLAINEQAQTGNAWATKVRVMSAARATAAVEERWVAAAVRNNFSVGQSPVVASNGREFLLAWQGESHETNLLRLHGDGSVIDNVPFVLEAARTELSRPAGDIPAALVWTGTEWLLARQHEHNVLLPMMILPPMSTICDLQGVFISEAMRQIGTVIPITPANAPEYSDSQTAAIAWSGDSGLVVWSQQFGWPSNAQVTAVRIGRTGIATPFQILGEIASGARISVRPDGDAFKAGWQNHIVTIERGGATSEELLDPAASIEQMFTIGSTDAVLLTRPDPNDLVGRLWLRLWQPRRRSATH